MDKHDDFMKVCQFVEMLGTSVSRVILRFIYMAWSR